MKTQCAHCSATHQVSEEHRGKRAKCSKCKQTFVVEFLDGISLDEVPVPASRIRPPGDGSAPSRKPVVAASGSAKESVFASDEPSRIATEETVAKIYEASADAIAGERSVRDAGQWSVEQRRSQVMAGFRRNFERPKTSTSYRLGMMAAMIVMLLLPLLYISFVVAIGAIVWFHMANNWVVLEHVRGRGAVIAFLLYLAPAVAGVIAIIFMFKPLLARPVKQGRIRSLTAKGEPVLFEYVKRICDEVGAPIPKRIDINNEVNASASFRAGWWSILRGNDLVLTLGLPLISGLSLQQLAGVIAHEFGHFSQGAGMRVSYVLRSINHWFVRAVYERDSWDAWLESASAESDIRIGWIFYLARLAVWLSRRFLWCLMYLGYLLTGIIQKQMEYDADRYEVGMAGKTAFASTFRALRTTAIGYQQAMDTLSRISSEGRLVSDIPRLARVHADKLPTEQLDEFLDKSMKEKAHYFDSHPSDNDRIAAAAKASDTGTFESSLPASALMQHFEAACIGVTNDAYEAIYGKNLSKLKIVPTSEVVDEQSREDAAWEALNRFFLNAIAPTREFPLPSYRFAAPEDTRQATDRLEQTRQVMQKSIDHYQSNMLIEERAADRKLKQEFIDRLQRKFSNVDKSGLEKSADEKQPSIPNPDFSIAEKFVRASSERLHTCCCLLNEPSIASRIPDASQQTQKLATVLLTLQAIDANLPKVKEIEKQFGYIVFCFGHFDRIKGDQSMLVREVIGVSEELVQKYGEFRKALLDLPYPFEHADTSMTVGKHLTTDVLIAEEVGNVANACGALISEYYNLRGRCLGHLVMAAEMVEEALGLPPTLSKVD